MMYFRGRQLPEPGTPAGYAALVDGHDLPVPLPPHLTAIAERHHPESTSEWQMLTPRHAPEESLGSQLEFALKWEGVQLSVLSALFRKVPGERIARLIREKPTGAYTRRLWFLYEWLTGDELDVPDSGKVKAVPVLDPEMHFARQEASLSRRHRVRDNLPGTRAFCPLVRRTSTLEEFRKKKLDGKARDVVGRTHPDVVRRAAAFLLLEDSRASFQIEGERPSKDRARRWGQAIEQAGERDLSVDELLRLQERVIGDDRFVDLGLRDEGGWLGERDRQTREPIPEHISARPDDVPELVDGVVDYEKRVGGGQMDPVVAAATVSFGFVYIHPFQDGNGRIHRWLVHHVLARAGYNPPGLVFPVSAPMLRNLAEYRDVLRSYSERLLPFIEWRATERGNVEVLNETADYYRFFDATRHAEFLYRCVQETVERDLPGEVAYLQGYDEFSRRVQEHVADMPERTIERLTQFLGRNDGRLSKRARTGEFQKLSDEEVERVESLYAECFPEEAPRAAGY